MVKLIFSACAAILAISSTANADLLDSPGLVGTWQQEGYGRVMDITSTAVKVYDVTSKSCVLASQGGRDEIEEYFLVASVAANRWTAQDGITKYHLNRISKIPATCAGKTMAANNSILLNFDVLWQTFTENYAFFSLRGVDWNKALQTFRKKLTSSSKPKALYDVMTDMVDSLGDDHVYLEAPSSVTGESDEDDDGPDFETLQADIAKRYLSKSTSFKGGLIRYGPMRNPNFGYIQINAMEDLESAGLDDREAVRKLMDQIIPQFKDKKAVILDVRFNGGGWDDVAIEIMNHFTNKKIAAFTKKTRSGSGYTPKQTISLTPAKAVFTKKVFILTSRQTASAAEIMVLSSMVLPHVTRIGSSTNGILSDQLYKTLPNRWEFALSNEVYETMTGKLYEKIGIPPHIKIGYSSDEDVFYDQVRDGLTSGDNAIDKALAEVK